MGDSNKRKFNDKVQLITCNHTGVVSFSDANLFTSVSEGDSIYDLHPFFEIVKGLQQTYSPNDNEFSFPCVHLAIGSVTEERICDINVTIELSEIHVVIFDYSAAYKKLNKISQERNESIIRNQELEFSNKLLLEKESFKNDFIANINHEVSTPITSIKGFLDLLKKTDLSYEQEELIQIIIRESEYLERIFGDMLDLSKIETGSFQLLEEPFDLIELIDSIVDSYKHIAEENALEFEVNIDSKLNAQMVGDKTRIYQIVNNLLNNSFKYTEEGFVKFKVSKIGGKYKKQIVQFEVEDSGIGVDKEHQASMFEAFVQHNDKGEGSGLGLHVVKNLVHLMKGKIAVESELGKGTKFVLDIRLRHNLGTNEKESTPIPKLEIPKSGRYRVLVVENKRSTQYLITRLLLNQGCFFVDVVSTAEEAIKAIEHRTYDLLILDIKLGAMSGFDLAVKIRKEYSDEFIKDVPILGISAIKTLNIENLCAINGIDSFLAKPFSEELLMGKITKLFKRKGKVMG
ncbi:ATP-binding response regulator [Aquimarina agarivorans]|uniref:ATP-binding response regulator n=1 Tax=Aquimarina agarivorans TaxID=980584 RepID=UPI000248E6F6|nr:hybrid sensor histidine kinase/response regulator [Aquimarina agarivorans]